MQIRRMFAAKWLEELPASSLPKPFGLSGLRVSKPSAALRHVQPDRFLKPQRAESIANGGKLFVDHVVVHAVQHASLLGPFFTALEGLRIYIVRAARHPSPVLAGRRHRKRAG